jgi:hypothetical protein
MLKRTTKELVTTKESFFYSWTFFLLSIAAAVCRLQVALSVITGLVLTNCAFLHRKHYTYTLFIMYKQLFKKKHGRAI